MRISLILTATVVEAPASRMRVATRPAWGAVRADRGTRRAAVERDRPHTEYSAPSCQTTAPPAASRQPRGPIDHVRQVRRLLGRCMRLPTRTLTCRTWSIARGRRRGWRMRGWAGGGGSGGRAGDDAAAEDDGAGGQQGAQVGARVGVVDHQVGRLALGER